MGLSGLLHYLTNSNILEILIIRQRNSTSNSTQTAITTGIDYKWGTDYMFLLPFTEEARA